MVQHQSIHVKKVVYSAHKNGWVESQMAVLQGSYTFYNGGIWRAYLGNERMGVETDVLSTVTEMRFWI
jgi:hypothetical protein